MTWRVRIDGHRRAGDDEADEVERIGRVQHDAFAGALDLAHLRELLDRLGQRVLLAGEAGDEPTAAHEAAVFEPAQRPLDLAPREAHRVVEREVAEHHAPAVQQQLGDGFGELVAVDVGAGRGTSDQRPAAAPGEREPRSRRGQPAGVGTAVAARRRSTRDRMAPKPSAVSRPRETPSHSARSMSSGKPVGGVAELAREARAALAEHLDDLGGRADRGLGRVAAGTRGFEQPREVVAVHDGDRRGLRRRPRGCVGVVADAGREPQPAHLAVVAEAVEPRRVVVPQPAREQVGLPRHRGRLVALELFERRRPARLRPRAGCRGRRAASASRKRMKSCAVAGSTPCRRVRRE